MTAKARQLAFDVFAKKGQRDVVGGRVIDQQRITLLAYLELMFNFSSRFFFNAAGRQNNFN